MKIILEAFNKMVSKPMDIPEETGTIFKMVLTQPLIDISGYDGKEIGNISPVNTMCEFEWIGKYQDGAKVYALRDIVKLRY